MTDEALLTLREARAVFYHRNGFPQDGGAQAQRWAPFGCRDLKVHLPNFKWRRRALPLHDLHHVITGYQFSPSGEFEMAAWEFAAGRYPHILSTLFCLPLVGIGAVVIPQRTFLAFTKGRRSKTLYAERDIDTLLDRTVRDTQLRCLPAGTVQAEFRDWVGFVALVVTSALVISSPLLLASAILFFWR